MSSHEASNPSNPYDFFSDPTINKLWAKETCDFLTFAAAKHGLPPIVLAEYDPEEEIGKLWARCRAYINGSVYGSKTGKIVDPGKVMKQMHWRIKQGREDLVEQDWPNFKHVLGKVWRFLSRNDQSGVGYGDFETNENNKYLLRIKKLREVGDNECLIRMHDQYVREWEADIWHYVFVHLLEQKLHRIRRLKKKLEHIKGVLEAELEDQMADIPLDYNFFTYDDTY